MKTKLFNTAMKTTLAVLLTLAMMLSASFAQSPDKLSYQAVVRDASGALVTGKTIGMKISILQGDAVGTEMYAETHTTTSNDNGLVSIEIGNGVVVSGSFSGINWANGPYFIKVETDPSGGNNYTISGTSQLLSVPYALHAESMTNIEANSPDADIEITADNAYSRLLLRPLQNMYDDSSEILLGEGYGYPVLGYKIVYDGANNLLKFVGETGGPSQKATLRMDRDQGTATFSKGVEVEETTTSPKANTVYGNALPIAYGYYSGTPSTSYGILLITNPSTGYYIISLSNDFVVNPVVMITTFNTTAYNEVATYDFQFPNIIRVRIVDSNNNPRNSNFSFVVFGTAQ